MSQVNNERESEKEKSMNTKADNVWKLGDYRSISTMLPPISAHSVMSMGIQSGESVLDVVCGNGNTAITAGRKGANATGIDIPSELLDLAVEEAKIAQVDGITWKKGGRIGFATWPPELAIGSIFRVNGKYLPKNPDAPPSPILWGIPEVGTERLNGVSEIFYERGTTLFPILSPNHLWEFMSVKNGPLLKTIQLLKNQDSANQINLFRADFLRAINPYVVENGIRLGYLLTVARK